VIAEIFDAIHPLGRRNKSICQNQPRLGLGHAENVLEFQELSQLGGLCRGQLRLSFALDQVCNALLGLDGWTEIDDIFRGRSTGDEVHQFEIDRIASVRCTSL